MQIHQITTPSATRPSGQTYEQEVKERQQALAAKAVKQRQAALHYQVQYRDEPLINKVKRLTQKHWMEFDAIRREVETFLPLAHPTPAQLRNYREQIARLVNQYRREAG